MVGNEGEQIKIDPSTRIIDQYLNPRAIPHLLTGEGKNEMMNAAKTEITDLGHSDVSRLTKTLIDGMGRDDDIWTLDRRDGALALLRVTPLKRVDATVLKKKYIDTIAKQEHTVDALEIVDGLLDTSLLLVPFFPPTSETKRDIEVVWDAFSGNLERTDSWNMVKDKYGEFREKLDTELGRNRVRRPSQTDVAQRMERVASLWETHSIDDIARILRVNPSVVKRYASRLKKAGLELSAKDKGGKPNPDVRNRQRKAKSFRDQGKPYREIAQQLGTNVPLTEQDVYAQRRRERGES